MTETTEETIPLAEERKPRLTELAQRVWPDVEVERGYGDDAWLVSNESGVALSIDHPRALDAMEAALLVLSGVDEPLSTSQAKDAFGQGFRAAQQLAGQVPIAPDWIALEMEKRIAEREVKHAQARIAELEDKLEKVRAWYARCWMPQGWGDELLDILGSVQFTPMVLAILDEERDAREPSAASLREIPEVGPDAIRLGRGAEGRENARRFARRLQKAYSRGYEVGRAGLSENNILATDADRISRVRDQLDRGKCRDSDVRYLLMLVESLNDRLAKITAHVNDRELSDDEARLFIAGVLDGWAAEIPDTDEPHTEEM